MNALTARTLDQLVELPRDGFDADAARGLIALRMPEAQVRRTCDLLAKQSRGEATPDDLAELEALDEAGTLVSILQSKARLALQRAGASGGGGR